MKKNRCIDENNPRLRYVTGIEDIRLFQCSDCGQYYILEPISSLRASKIQLIYTQLGFEA